MSTPWYPPPDFPQVLRYPPRSPPEGICRHAWAVQIAGRILSAACNYFRPVQVYACFSGGYDSATATVFTMQRLTGAKVLHINTGIGIEATRQYVRDTCEQFGWPLLEQRTPESYEQMVLDQGFPGPGMHGKMYQRLKERAIRIAMSKAKEGHHPHSTVMFVSGIRHDESLRRTGYQRVVSKVDSQVWVNPFYWADAETFKFYRTWSRVPRNPVKDKLGMSGECLCGAYAEPGELERIGWVCPETRAYIEDLERRVRAAGHDWGWEDPGPPEKRKRKGNCPDYVRETLPNAEVYIPDEEDFQPMCHNCDKVHMVKVGDRPWTLDELLHSLRGTK